MELIAFTERERSLLGSLNSDFGLQLDQVDNPAPGSCEWIFSHRKWEQWQNLQSSSLLWISSNAGCGKSVMAKYLIEYFQTAQNVRRTRNFGYFFFMDGITGQDNAASALSALLYQLFFSQRDLMKTTSTRNDLIEGSRATSVSRLWPIVSDAISDDNANDILWILDGLDECESTSSRFFLHKLARFLKSQNSGGDGKRNKACLKIILLSRPSSVIQGELQLHSDADVSDPGANYKIRLAMENENAALLGDIVRFARWKIDELSHTSALPAHILERLRERLVVGADFTFLWISLVIKVIEDAILNGISIASLEAILSTSGLDDVYQHLLKRPCRSLPSKTRRLLSIILASPQPLTIEEMCVAIEVDTHLEVNPRKATHGAKGSERKMQRSKNPGPKLWRESDNARRKGSVQSLQDIDGRLHKPFDNHIRQLCGHFVRVRSQRLYLVHQTAREFLMKASFTLGNTIVPEPDPEAQFLPQPSHALEDDGRIWQPIKWEDAMLTTLQICATYIKIFSREIDGTEESNVGEDSKICHSRCFMKYAALNWIHYYRPLRKSLNSQYDEMLQPETPAFEVWAKFHTSWATTHHQQDTPGAISIAGKKGEIFEENNIPGASSDIAKLLQVYGRFAKIGDWILGTWHCTSPPTVELRHKLAKFRHTLWRQNSFQSLAWYFQEGWILNTGYRQDFSKLEELFEDFEQTRSTLMQEDDDLQLLRVKPRIRDNMEIFIQKVRASNEGPKIKRQLLESLLHFDLFDPKDSAFGLDDEFLNDFGPSQQADGGNGLQPGSYQTEDAMPNWIKHYIRQRSTHCYGTPGADLPERSNPEYKTFDDSMAKLLESSGKAAEISGLRRQDK